MPVSRGAAWWGGCGHRAYTVCVYVVLTSLDNAGLTVMPPLYGVMHVDLATDERLLGLVTAGAILVAAATSVMWGYHGDRGARRQLLITGTVLWTVGVGASAAVPSVGWLLTAQLVAAVGFGAVASIGFSVVSDLVPPARRGVVMSLWGLAQGAGAVAGTLLGGVLGATDWRQPYVVLAAAGAGTAVLALGTYDVARGASEPQLAAAGGDAGARITAAQLPALVRRRTNVWLVVQGFTAQLAYGSLIWLPRLMQAKVEAQGHGLASATAIGSMFAALFQLGAVSSILGGWLGDRWQRRDPRGRALVSTIGVLAAIPFFVAMVLLPLPVEIPPHAGAGATAAAVARSVVTTPGVALVFVLALAAVTLTSADAPNWFALISDVNPPEHRGTVFGLGNLVNGAGRALGNGLVGVAFTALVARFPPPTNYAVGLAAFQLCFVPTGWAYWRASRTCAADIAATQALLEQRGARAGRAPATAARAPRSGTS